MNNKELQAETEAQQSKNAELLPSAPLVANPLLYAVLLEKYIKYVKKAEGTDFIYVHDQRHFTANDFTNSEWDILFEISNRLNYPNGV